MIYIVNRHKHTPTPNDIYIGRGSPLGNPFTHISDRKTKAEFIVDSIEIALSSYETYLFQKIEEKSLEICAELNRIYKKALIGDVFLVCFCEPKPCHGVIIKRIIESKFILN